MAEINTGSYLNFADLLAAEGFEFWETPDFPEIIPQDNDTYIEVDSNYFGRLDLLAFDQYGDVDLWWVIALANNLDIVPTQMKIGQKLRIPNKNYIQTLFARGIP